MSAELAPQKLTYADVQALLWREFVEKYKRTGYVPRKPAESLEGLESATGFGFCLAPILTHGTRMWFDPNMKAEPGDVVLAQFHETVIDRILRERADDAEFQRVYGEKAKRGELGRVIKLLAEYRGRRYLVTNDSMTPLDGGKYGDGPPLGPSKILGVLRNIGGSVDLLPGVQPPTPTEGIVPNAATEVITTIDASFTDVLAGTGEVVASIDPGVRDYEYLAIVTASYRVWITGTNTTSASTYLVEITPTPAEITLDGTFTNTVSTDNASPGRRVTLSGQVTVAAGTARQFGLRTIKLSGDAQHEIRDLNFQLEVIKR